MIDKDIDCMYQLYCADTNDDGGLDNELKSELNVPRMTYQFMKEVQIFHLHIVLDVNFQMKSRHYAWYHSSYHWRQSQGILILIVLYEIFRLTSYIGVYYHLTPFFLSQVSFGVEVDLNNII